MDVVSVPLYSSSDTCDLHVAGYYFSCFSFSSLFFDDAIVQVQPEPNDHPGHLTYQHGLSAIV